MKKYIHIPTLNSIMHIIHYLHIETLTYILLYTCLPAATIIFVINICHNILAGYITFPDKTIKEHVSEILKNKNNHNIILSTTPIAFISITYNTYIHPANYTLSIILNLLNLTIECITLFHYLFSTIASDIPFIYAEYLSTLTEHQKIQHYRTYRIPMQYNPKTFFPKRDYHNIKRAYIIMQNLRNENKKN